MRRATSRRSRHLRACGRHPGDLDPADSTSCRGFLAVSTCWLSLGKNAYLAILARKQISQQVLNSSQHILGLEIKYNASALYTFHLAFKFMQQLLQD